MQIDIDRAEERLAAARALPEDHPNRAAIIEHWRGELGFLRVSSRMDKLAKNKTARYARAKGKEKRA